MELVTIVEIDLNRPHSATAQGFHNGSNPASGRFLVADGSVETLRAQVINFAEKCGVSRGHLTPLQQVSGRNYSVGADVVVFDRKRCTVALS
jgi:hypothetical protein